MKLETFERLQEIGTLILQVFFILYAVVGIVGTLIYIMLGGNP